jgi:hypothetical protein
MCLLLNLHSASQQYQQSVAARLLTCSGVCHCRGGLWHILHSVESVQHLILSMIRHVWAAELADVAYAHDAAVFHNN